MTEGKTGGKDGRCGICAFYIGKLNSLYNKAFAGDYKEWVSMGCLLDEIISNGVGPKDMVSFDGFCEDCEYYPGIFEKDSLITIKKWWEKTNEESGIRKDPINHIREQIRSRDSKNEWKYW